MTNQVPFRMIFATSIFVLVLSGCSPQTDLEAGRLSLLRADAACAEAAFDNDLETLWTFWDEDSLMLMGANFRIKGLEEFKSFALRAREDPNFSITWEAEDGEVAASGDFGFTYGLGRLTRTGPDGEPVTVEQPYLTVWRKGSDGNWRSHVER